MKSCIFFPGLVLAVAMLLPAPAALSQNSTTAKAGAEPVTLSPFEVRADSDVGYQAVNTTSGSRLKSRLKDTPASISPFTPEFLSDIGATSLQDMMGYATNVEFESEDATNGFNNSDGRFATSTDYRFRMRGSTGGASLDYVASAVPVDLYNVERAEVASGPNSILFGLGNAGGNVSITTKRANASRNRTSLSNVIASWNYERFTADQNMVLVKQKLGLRLLGLYQNAGGWKYWDFNDQKRLGAAVAYKPFKYTTIHFNHEVGRHDGSTTINWNANDQVTAWLAAGRPRGDGAAMAGTTRNNTNNRYTFVENDNTVYNFRQELVSARIYNSETLMPPSLSPYAYNTVGPGGQRHQHFQSHSVLVEQKAGEVDFEFGYFRNGNKVTALSNGGQAILFGDPNITIPPASFAGSVPNLRAGQLYFEQPWTKDSIALRNDVVRLTTAWEKDLGRRFGRHRLAGLLEHSESDRLRYLKDEIFVNQFNAAIATVANPEGAQNQVLRRHYVTEGDFRTYYVGNGLIPTPEFAIGGNTYHSQYASRTKANAHTKQAINSSMLAAQSYWWQNRLVTTLGYRLDDITFRNERETRISGPTDPRVLNRSRVLNEWDFTGAYTGNAYRPHTFSTGGVFHLTNRVSLFYNSASNRGTPRFDRTVLPDGDVPPPTAGKSQDYGFMLDLLGDDRFFLRTTRYDTKQLRDAPIVPNSVAVETATGLGGNNLVNIYDALLSAGRITQAQYDGQLVFYSSGMVDVFTKGYEVEFVANPTKSISVRFGYSYSDRTRANIFQEIFDYYGTNTPKWLVLAAGNPGLIETIKSEVDLVYTKLDDQLDVQSGGLGNRPHKFNLTGRYQFRDGLLKSLTIGGAARYQGANTMSYNRTTGATTKGNETLFGDAFVSYQRKSFLGPGNMKFQINVRNLTNDYLAGIGRRNADGNAIRRVYLNEPRSIRFTTTLEF